MNNKYLKESSYTINNMSEINIELYHDYLNRLNQMNSYKEYLKVIKKRDNLTNLKTFFNKYIFISIQDFHQGHYDKLFFTNKDLKYYLNQYPEKRSHKKIIKKEKVYRIFLRNFK
jgi:hypothetical protein